MPEKNRIIVRGKINKDTQKIVKLELNTKKKIKPNSKLFSELKN